MAPRSLQRRFETSDLQTPHATALQIGRVLTHSYRVQQDHSRSAAGAASFVSSGFNQLAMQTHTAEIPTKSSKSPNILRNADILRL